MNCHTSLRLDVYRCYFREALLRQRSLTSESTDKEFDQLFDDLFVLHKFVVMKYENEMLHLLQDLDDCMKNHSSVALYFISKRALEAYERDKGDRTPLLLSN